MGKAASIKGTFSDGTAFTDITVDEIADELESLGYDRFGQETLYNGFTGQQIKTKIFIGPTFYQRLKHLVETKYHSRSYGPVQMLTRQPVEGRASQGGHRFGEINSSVSKSILPDSDIWINSCDLARFSRIVDLYRVMKVQMLVSNLKLLARHLNSGKPLRVQSTTHYQETFSDTRVNSPGHGNNL